MSYVEIEIGPLKQDEKGIDIPGSNKRGLDFNQVAHFIIQEEIDPEYAVATLTPSLFFGGLKGYCYENKIKTDFTLKDVCGWVEDLSEDTILNVYNVYMGTKTFLKAKGAQEDKKKVELLMQENTEKNVSESPAAD